MDPWYGYTEAFKIAHHAYVVSCEECRHSLLKLPTMLGVVFATRGFNLFLCFSHEAIVYFFNARAESNFFYMSFIDSWSSEKLKQFATLSLFTAVAMKNHPPHSKCNPPDKLFQSLSDRYQRKQWLQPLFDTFLLFQIINNRRLR